MNQFRSVLSLVILSMFMLSAIPASAAPAVNISAPSTPITKNGPVSFSIDYTGASAVNLSAADITLNKTGTANGTVFISGAGSFSPIVSIQNITGDGTLGISLTAGTAVDGSG